MKTALRIIIIVLLCVVIAGGFVFYFRTNDKAKVDTEQTQPDISEEVEGGKDNNEQVNPDGSQGDNEESGDNSNNTNGDESTKPPIVDNTPTTYSLTFRADGVDLSTQTFVDENSVIVEPEVPAKAGYTGEWQQYDLDVPVSQIALAIYTPIVYTIDYHVVVLSNGAVTTMDYLGTWEEYWGEKLSVLDGDCHATEYTVESEDIRIGKIDQGLKVSETKTVFLEGFYTDELCTEKFSGVIPKGSTGNLTLYVKRTGMDVGNY